MSKHFVNKRIPDLGYYEVVRVEAADGVRFRWNWTEVEGGTEHFDCGQWFPTKAEAYRDAADDWEANGSAENGRLAGQLRAAATRSERAS